MSHEPQQQRRPRRWAAGAATLALAVTGFSALSTTTASATASATEQYRPTPPCYQPRESQTVPPTVYVAPGCGTWRLVPEWNPLGLDWGPSGEKMLAHLLWENSHNPAVDKYNIYRDGQYYDTVTRYGSYGSYYDRAPTSGDHVYQIVSVFETGSGNEFSSKSAPLVKRR